MAFSSLAKGENVAPLHHEIEHLSPNSYKVAVEQCRIAVIA
jgi:hypothetical protein